VLSETLYTVYLQQRKSIMTFKALLYMCYARRGPIGAESIEQRGVMPHWNFLTPSGQFGAPWHLNLIKIFKQNIVKS